MPLVLAVMCGLFFINHNAKADTLKSSIKELQFLVLGDSLTAGYNLPASEALPAVLETQLAAQGWRVKMINGGVSGDTAAQGLARLDWMLNQPVDGVIVALGANDMLRGIDPARTQSDLQAIVVKLKNRSIPVMLVGMRANPTMGTEYVQAFEKIYTDLARTYNLVFYPFMLQNVAGNASLNQSDGLHPNKQGVETIARLMLPTVEKFISNLNTLPSPQR